jgi:putative mRNA 3-end processing factor
MIRVSAEHGLEVDLGGTRIGLDDYRGTRANYLFISHAHGDHLGRISSSTPVLSSDETALLAAVRGVALKVSSLADAELLPTGHILGAMALRLSGDLLYTGDLCDRNRGPLLGFDPPKVRTLIIESTYGSAEFCFPPVEDVMGVARDAIEDCLKRDIPVVVMGYALGKAQHLELLLAGVGPAYICPELKRYDDIYRLFGVEIPPKACLANRKDKGLLEKGPWILFAPFRSGRSSFNKYLERRFGARLMAFSGWACKRGYKEAMAVSEAFPLSDHSDFEGLLRVVKRSRASRVFTTHGFADELALHLRGIGYDAQPLPRGQRTLNEYLEGD